jgi:hypothetical protein
MPTRIPEAYLYAAFFQNAKTGLKGFDDSPDARAKCDVDITWTSE